MYFYEVGYYSYEEFPMIQLVHDEQYNEEEFEGFVLSVVKDAIVRTKAESSYLGDRFEDIYRHVADLLCERYGFKHMEFSASYAVDGWANMHDPTGLNDESDERKARLAELLTKGE